MGKKSVVLFLSILLLSISCNKKSEKSLTPSQEKILNVYIELAVLREKYTLTDSVFIDSSKIIFKKYGLSQKLFKEAISEFRKKPEQWEIFFNQVLKQMPKKKRASANPG